MKKVRYLLNSRNFIFIAILFAFTDNFGMEDEKNKTYTFDNFRKDLKNYDIMFKTLFLGDVNVGKTQIINQLMKKKL